nr:endonuclease [Shimia sp. R9_2]
MISPRLLMTNNHVLRNAEVAALSYIEFDYALGVDGRPMTPVLFGFDPQVFFETSRALDFTIVAMEQVSSNGEEISSRGWMHLISDSGKAVAGEPINIIQHPGGQRQQIAIRANKILRPIDDFLLYTTDTLGGSSGSFCANDQWQVAALHHAGVPDKDESGRWLKKNGSVYQRGVDNPNTINWIANEGVRISSIVAEMRSRSLSAEEDSLFAAAFDPAPSFETQFLANSNSPALSSETSPPQQGISIGQDGVARWNFQLSFGPVGDPKQKANFINQSPIPDSPPAPIPAYQLPLQAEQIESVFDPRGTYYDSASDKKNVDQYYEELSEKLSKKELFWALNSLLKDTHHTSLSYSDARHNHLYPWIDRHEDETLRSIYSNDIMAEELFVAERAALEIALTQVARNSEITLLELTPERIDLEDAELEATNVFNCEHVVPQSWFKGEAEQRKQKTDMHHLFACESGCNSFRSNVPYSEFSEKEGADLQGKEVSLAEALEDPDLEAFRPMCGLRDKRRFEPSAGKGAVSRATLYFLLRYPGVIGDVKSGSKKELTKSSVGILLDWATSEPPTLYELHRNAEIAKVQGNRNPLIDHPDLLLKIAFEEGFG